MSKILIIEYEARFQTPLLKLNSLEDDVKIT